MNLLPLHDTPAFGPGFILDWLVCGRFITALLTTSARGTRSTSASSNHGAGLPGSGRLTSAVAVCATDTCTGIEQGETYALSGSGRNKLYAATVKTRVVAAGTGAEVVARDSRSGAPML